MLRQAAILLDRDDGRAGDQPAPAPEVGDRAFLDILLDEIARYGVFERVLIIASRAQAQVAQRCGESGRGGMRIEIACGEGTGAAAAGASLSAVSERLDSRFLLVDGLSFFDINLLDLATTAGDSLAHLALRPGAAGDRARRFVVAREGLITGFVEADEALDGPVHGGLCVVDKRALERLARGGAIFFRDGLPALVAQGAVTGRCYDRYFLDLDAPGGAARAQTELPRRLTRPAVFFDRDGVLNRDTDYVHRPDDFIWTPGAREAVKAANDAGWFAFVVTNQSGVARGYYTEADVRALHAWMARELAADGAHIDAFEFCPDHPDAVVKAYRRSSPDRKPGPGMLKRLMARFRVDRSRSFLVGDKEIDMQAAAAAGISGHRYTGGDLKAFVTERIAGADRAARTQPAAP